VELSEPVKAEFASPAIDRFVTISDRVAAADGDH
jgi:hypothetical protein